MTDRVRPPVRPRSVVGSVVLALLTAAMTGAVEAQAVRSVSLAIDNDGFTFWTPREDRTDWYYTHGLEIASVTGWSPGGLPLFGGDALPVCPPDPWDEPCTLTRFAAGQDIYTPASLFTYSGENDDRPYAGWLYSEATWARVAPRGLTTLGLQVGVTGEPSFGGTIHRWFHRSLGKHEPVGWEHQLPFEVAFLVEYATRRAVPLVSDAPGLVDLQPHASVALGTLRTGATGGLSLTLGCSTAGCLDWMAPGPSPYILASFDFEGELVLRDLFLDGSTWTSSPRTERVPWLGRLKGQVQVGWSSFGLEFAATRSTVEFRDQLDPHTYGTLRLIIR